MSPPVAKRTCVSENLDFKLDYLERDGVTYVTRESVVALLLLIDEAYDKFGRPDLRTVAKSILNSHKKKMEAKP